MHPDIHLVIELQSLDQRIAALEKEIAALPKHIAALEKTLEIHVRRLEADKAALAANQKDRKTLEGDIQMQEQKVSKLKDQSLSVKNNEQYRALLNEVEFIQKEVRKAEDRILELMADSELLEGNVKKAEGALKEEKQQVEAEKASARQRTAEDQAELDRLRGERREAAAKQPAPTLATYDRERKKWSGSTVGEAARGRCSACQIVIRPQYMQDLKRGDQLMMCESCGRFLHYNPVVNVEDGTRLAM
jgi:uncharacterized protein